MTPFDRGVSVLKSDRYLQFAQSAQLDFLIQAGLIGRLLRRRIRVVNVSQLIRFARPIRLFRWVRFETSVISWR